MKSIEGNFNNSEVNDLLKKHFIELRSVSPAGSTHVLDIDGLKDPSIKFWSLWENNNLVGCGALKFLEKNKFFQLSSGLLPNSTIFVMNNFKKSSKSIFFD